MSHDDHDRAITPPRCIDCRYHRVDFVGDHRCMASRTLSLVGGSDRDQDGFCHVRRNWESDCGRSGRYFSPRPVSQAPAVHWLAALWAKVWGR